MIGATQLVLFVALSSVAAVASLHAWRTRLSYGFLRFFAFEFLAVLIVCNASRWFRDPLSIRQIISWIIMAASTALAAHGIHLLRSEGKARSRVMEDTETVVEVGIYRLIRHPLYASLLFFGWGVFLKGPDLASAALSLGATVFWVETSRSEERFNIDRFGAPYLEYMQRTKMFIPFLL
jgi:protein-S-isoprenylcysteine O-methyltransferase Ste14